MSPASSSSLRSSLQEQGASLKVQVGRGRGPEGAEEAPSWLGARNQISIPDESAGVYILGN